ncbi:helix-turn-helix domain-containing protein [Shouchella clausii]|uniref:helix-turn-helix domain-containing protein n=1 Tax=Shouchella clausii TaxID=79880 RepID=UPI001C735311|nr:helix-turn-helix transcriptional regulator [Shouchella clausii]MBX0320205.1 helix-turn-helix transcriptional regulator [Shouchella clausii]
MEIKVTPILSKILKERGLTQQKLSELTGINQGSISRFDRNSLHKDSHLFTIAKALDLKIENLFEIECIESNTEVKGQYNSRQQKGYGYYNPSELAVAEDGDHYGYSTEKKIADRANDTKRNFKSNGT